jgi:hypothetical protein
MKAIGFVLSIALLLSVNSCTRKITEPYSETVATPVFTPQPYLYDPGQKVTIECSTPGAEIRYTLDGSTPDKHSQLYSEPVQIDSTTTIKAIAYKQKMNPSAVAIGTFQIYLSIISEDQAISQMVAEPDTINAESSTGLSTIRVKVVNMENFGVPGQRIEFYTNLGNISPIAFSDSAGIARATLTSPGTSGIARVTAVMKKFHPDYPEFVICADTAWVDVTINDLPAEQERHITSITADPLSIYADNGITFSNISVTVKDGNNNPVSGQDVLFRTTLGNILTSVVTDAAGVASSVLWDEGIVGVASVSAIVRNYDTDNPDQILSQDTAHINIAILPSPTNVYSIRFTQMGQIDLNVANTGMDSWILKVKLYNHDGNLITEHKNVWFRILNSGASGGANLNNQEPGDSVLSVSQNGIAQVTLHSGTVPGTLIVKASCTDNGRYRETVKDNIVVHPAPPYRVEIFSSGYNTGINMGGGNWEIVVGAMVYDIFNNPVSYGTSVWFQIPDNTYNCQIGANAYVGNESVLGDSTAGVAYTTLIYHGSHSLDSITIRASSGGINGQEVIGQSVIVLPLNQPQLDMVIIPGNLVFHGNVNPIPESATATINASIFDIQGCPIHHGRINLSATYGDFEPIYGTNRDPMNCNPHAQPNIIVTDWYDQNAIYEWYYDPYYQIPGGPDINEGLDGLAQGQIRFLPDGIPLGDPMVGCPGVLPVTITAALLGTDVIASGQITLIRYPT